MIIDARLYRNNMRLPVDGSHVSLGTMGELLVARLLEAQGYQQLARGKKMGDLRVADALGEIYRVEVKTARRDKDGHWQFCLFKRGKTDCWHSDWLVLLAVTDLGIPVPFVLPATRIISQKVSFRSQPEVYSGYLAQYRQSLQCLELRT